MQHLLPASATHLDRRHANDFINIRNFYISRTVFTLVDFLVRQLQCQISRKSQILMNLGCKMHNNLINCILC